MEPQQRRKVITLQTISHSNADPVITGVANTAGFSIHASIAAEAYQQNKN